MEEIISGIIYSLCALAAFLCAWLLLRTYRRSSNKLILWGGVCFAGLTISNILLVIDKLMLPAIDLSPVRHGITLASILILLYGLIWDTE